VTTYRILHAQASLLNDHRLVLKSFGLQPTIIRLYEQAHLAMKQYKEGKWSPNASTDDVDVDVMKLIGRPDFAPAKTEEATISVATCDHTVESIPTSAHPALFEYMKQFEQQPDKGAGPTIQPTQPSVPHFLEHDMFLESISELENKVGAFESQVSEQFLGDGDNESDLPRPALFSITSQTSQSTNWHASALHGDPSLTLNPLQGRTPNTSLRFDDLFLDQGATSNHSNEEESHDQVWEQFLSTLMS
jgi:hypothetical protein